MTRALQFVAVLLAVLWTVGAEEVAAQTAPTVTAMSLNSPETASKSSNRHNDYFRSEVIRVTVTFSDSVVVTGTPYIELSNIKDESANPDTLFTDCFAEYLPRTRDTTLVMVFEYQVQLNDRTRPEGITIAANALKLNGGTINAKSGGTPANLDLTSYAFTNDLNRRIGNRGGQDISNVSLNSPPSGDTFRQGDTIRVTFTYHQDVGFVNTHLQTNIIKARLTIGEHVRHADYVSGHFTGQRNWIYRYIVQADDVDADGISISRRSILEKGLTGDVIHNGAISGYSARSPGRRQRIVNSANHKVDGRIYATLALSPASISENGGVSTVTATLDRTVATATTITVSATAVAPAVAGDFTLSQATTLTIAANATTSTGTVTITGVDNMDDALDKSVTVSGTATGGIQKPPDLTLTITDDEGPQPILALSPASISENGGVSTVTATLLSPESGAVTITVSATAVLPAVAMDFTLSSPSTLTIAAGSTTSTGLVTIAAVDNNVSAVSKTVTVSGTADDTPDVVAEPSDVTLTITDDDVPQVSLVLSPQSISENGGVSTVTATLDITATTAATVIIDATAVSPAVPGDFTVSSNDTLIIAAGSTTSTGTVTITAVDNTADALDKSVTVSGTATGGDNATVPSAVTLTITDDEGPQPILALSPASISENGGVTTVTATLLSPESGAVTITVSAAPVLPAVAMDFTLSPANTLTIAAGSTTSTGLVTIAAVDNNASAASKTVTVSGTADDTPNVVLPPDDVTLTITDDDVPQVSLVLSPASISENGGVSTVTATLDITATTAATVIIDATAVSPAVPGDFTVSSNDTLIIAAGSTTSTGTVTITAVDNTADALDKSVTVSGTATGGDNATGPSAVTLTITDDEAATATLALSSATISENGGMTTVTATLSTPEDGAVTITVSATPVLPAVVGDFTLLSPSTLTIAAGSTTSTGLVTITTVDNSAATGSKTVTVSGTADDTPDVVQPPSAVTLTITDDDVPQVALVLSPASISENGEVSTVTATLDRIASTAATVIIEATAVAPAVMGDFTLSSNDTLIIAASATTSTGTVTITAVDNRTDAPDKSVTVSGTATGGNSATSPSAVTLAITDDDLAPTVTLAVAPTSISENGGSTTVTAVLSRPSSAATTITVRPVAGAYTVGSDSTIAFAAGDTANASDTVVISAVDNSQDEADRTATVLGVMVNDQGVGAVTRASLTLTDDDDPPVISIDSPSMTEDTPLSFTVTLSAASGREITVVYSDAASGTATSGTDYTALAAGTLTFAIGVTSQTIAVSVTDDGTDEPDEMVDVTLSGPTNATLGTATGTGTITDNDDPPLLSIDSPSEVEANSGGSSILRFTVTLNAASGKQVTVTYADAGTGSADPGADYMTLTPGTLTFAVGVTSQTFDVSVAGDADDESNETVAVTLSSPTNATFAGGALSITGTGTIIDNDGMPALSITTPPRVMEGGATLTFRVYLSPASAQQVTVIYQDTGTGSATSGTDYMALARGTLVFAAGETEKTFDVSLLDDNVKEPDETVIITLRSPVNAIFDGGVTTLTSTGTIINDDANPTVSISSPSVAEGNSGSTTLPFTVTLNTATMQQVTVAYADAGTGSATSGTDYTALAAGTLIFAPGETEKTLDISVRGDTAVEPDETVVIALSDPVNALLGMASGTGTITNDDRSATDPEPDPDTEPVFIEAADPQTYRKNQAIEFTLPAAIDGNGTLTYTLTDLPEGLTFDAETLTVSGTPSEATEKAIYTLTVTDEDDDSAEMSFFITVLANVAPSFGDASVDAQAYLRKQAIESLTLPRATGGDGSLTYALTPDLPDDLVFDTETRMLSGTPLEVIAETTYTLTATDGDGDAATLTFTLEVMADPMPTFGDTTVAAQSYLQHREIDPLTLPQAIGGDGTLTYALTPDLPEGLTFDAETLIVSGTPSKAMDAMTYTLTATDGNGDVARLMFTLEIPDLMPTFGDTTLAAQSYLVNQQIESLTLPQATGGDGTLAYFLLPFLPDSLTFDPKTRVLSGTPTETQAETTYTLSALDADGDVASLTFTLAVQMPSSDFDGDGDVNFADFLTFAGKFGSRRGQDRYDARCDLNADGQIDFADFLIFAANFGATG